MGRVFCPQAGRRASSSQPPSRSVRRTTGEAPAPILPQGRGLEHDPPYGRRDGGKGIVPQAALELDALHIEEDGEDIRQKRRRNLFFPRSSGDRQYVDGIVGRAVARQVRDQRRLLLQVEVQRRREGVHDSEQLFWRKVRAL